MLIGTETEIIEQGNLHIHTEQGQGFPKPGRQALAVSDEFQQSIGDQFCVMIDAAFIDGAKCQNHRFHIAAGINGLQCILAAINAGGFNQLQGQFIRIITHMMMQQAIFSQDIEEECNMDFILMLIFFCQIDKNGMDRFQIGGRMHRGFPLQLL